MWVCPDIVNTLAFENVTIGLAWPPLISVGLATNWTLWKAEFKYGERANFEP